MSKQLPDTREEAFAYQFEDDVKILHQMAAIKNKESFRRHLVILQAHIDAYNNLDLQKSCEEAEETHPYNKKDIEEFYIWKDENRWFRFVDGKWNYAFEHGTSIDKNTYEKHYRKTTNELLQLWKEQKPKMILGIG